MNTKIKIASAVISASLLVSPISTLVSGYDNVAKAKDKTFNENTINNENNSFEIEINFSEIDIERELYNAQIRLNKNLISQEEYNLIEMILKPEIKINPYLRSAYYPETKIGYINYWGVKHMYEKGLRYGKLAETLSSIAFGLIPGVGWGLSAISIAATYGGYNYLEKVVQQAYWQGKGIDIYIIKYTQV
ncbi:hypothetical protein [Gemella sp. zg-1178]|uniref:hypothetical protein n=1 Tax=Gemella sp. zg-1178 TaxID=2840372 RepID=UPI001C04A7BF|nr:hypothetical protein [Gemella sp. zg-1178]MBU0278770.1 hypothetical protein [Gemella sp. zg-1178]